MSKYYNLLRIIKSFTFKRRNDLVTKKEDALGSFDLLIKNVFCHLISKINKTGGVLVM